MEDVQGEAGDEDIVLQEYHSEDDTAQEDRSEVAGMHVHALQ